MKTLSFVIPVYNEERRLIKVFRALKRGFYFDGVKLKEIIFVNDGSTDKTFLKLQKQKSIIEKEMKVKVKIISYEKNKGKGYAVKRGVLASKSDYSLVFDVDMSTPLSEFKKFLPYIKKNIPIIIGTRKNGKSTVIKPQPFYRQFLGKGFTLLSNILLKTWVSDFTCGFKAFSKDVRRSIFPFLKIERWGYDAEILFLASKMGFEIKEVPVKWGDDENSKVNVFRDVFYSLIELFLIRIYHSNMKDKLRVKDNFVYSVVK